MHLLTCTCLRALVLYLQGEDLALIKAHTGEDRLEFASKLRVGSLTVNSLDDFSIEEGRARRGVYCVSHALCL